ncbi:UPF0764 protein C16orf89 [Plecturocebus cupreus]
MMAHVCNPSYSGGFGRRIIGTWEAEAALNKTGSYSVAQAGVHRCNHSSLQLPTPGLKQSSHLSFLSCWDYKCVPPCLANYFIFFLSEMGSHYVDLADLELLASSNPPTLASQSAGITDMRHHTQPELGGSRKVKIGSPQSRAVEFGFWRKTRTESHSVTRLEYSGAISAYCNLPTSWFKHCCGFCFVFDMAFCSCCGGWSAMARSKLTVTSIFQIQVILLPQTPK